MSTYSPTIAYLQPQATAASAAANTDRQPWACPELLAAGVGQIPDDVHRIFAVYGDLADEQLSGDQVRRFKRAVRQAQMTLRNLYLDRQLARTCWDGKDWQHLHPRLEYEDELEQPVEMFGAVMGSGNYTPNAQRPKTKFGEKRRTA